MTRILRKPSSTAASINGVSILGTNLTETSQNDLVVTSPDEPTVTVNDLEIAHYIGLYLHSRKIRSTISSTARNMVLVLGRFRSGAPSGVESHP